MHQIFPVTGITCAACAVSIESFLSKTEGVDVVVVNLADHTVSVTWDPAVVTLDALADAVGRLGYGLVIEPAGEQPAASASAVRQWELVKLGRRMWLTVALALPVFVLGMFFHHSSVGQWISAFLTTLILGGPGFVFFRNAFRQIRYRMPAMDTLVALSTGIAWSYSLVALISGIHSVWFESAAVIVAFVLVGKYVEERAKNNSVSAIGKLMALQPARVTVVRNGEELLVSPEKVLPFDRVVVKPATRIPVDGKVIRGESFVDESMITGEPVAAEKRKGDPVVAGTLNQLGSLLILAEKTGDETLLAQIIRVVRQAQATKAPAQKLADSIAAIFVPVVLLIALVTFALWMVIGGADLWQQAITAAISVLIVACPCALGLATPTAIIAGIGLAAESGILVRDAEALERLRKVDLLLIDKTGTLTRGRPEVVHLVCDDDRQVVLPKFLALLNSSSHPLAIATAGHLAQMGVRPEGSVESLAYPGLGMMTESGGDRWMAGNQQFMVSNGAVIPDRMMALAEEWSSAGCSLVWFSVNQELKGVAALSDALRPEARATIDGLQSAGIRVVMLTGDDDRAAATIASRAGITEYHAALLPVGKSRFVEMEKRRGRVVAMVGDGINDAAALALADVSIAMGTGTDIAMEVSGLTLIHSNPADILTAMNISRATSATIRQNLFWAFFYNLVCIPVAAGLLYPLTGFLLSPMVAGAAMSLSSITVVVNSLRLKSLLKRRPVVMAPGSAAAHPPH